MANEKRLIDANALVDWLTKHTGFRGNCEDCTEIDCLDCIVENAIKNTPTVDAVEVVRCKDCNYFGGHGMCYCHAADEHGTPIFVREDDFCSYGERRTSDENL